MPFQKPSLSTRGSEACLVDFMPMHTTENPAPTPPTCNIGWSIDDHSIERQDLGLCINIGIDICTEAIDSCDVSLRSTLATEGRSTFTTNLLHSFIVLGAVFLLQAIIAITITGAPIGPTGSRHGAHRSSILLWCCYSQPPHSHHLHLDRYIISVRTRHAQPRTAIAVDLTSEGAKDRVVHVDVRACVCHWGAVVVQLTNTALYKNLSWSFFPNGATFTHTFNIGTSTTNILLTSIVVIVAQSPLTMGLHGCEIITNIVHDEKTQKRTWGASGALMSSSIHATIKDLIGRLVLRSIAVGSSWRSDSFSPRRMGTSRPSPTPLTTGPRDTGGYFGCNKPAPTPPYSGVYHAGTCGEKLPPVKIGFPYAGEGSLI
ncbi:hypothetical protein FIBSPDRAFT_933416 [Athelia psychrophila]|uniref:Uncharacterized protein n=1 Tax=Athelia psychrophila TaxID=1759441 RepID=A0A166H3T4_9AGAM|nr:hypothetical protein FIBSPDRAFT_933416 [Fibularhizoctonia sp. CBS 109695]